ncbi:hypothetical protein C8Q70DRAFT_950301 [Cubamyces menziesii]|nr:hypothetical protein C8Q70DRAFT_950301 [Cubamyces menziesii]
MSSYSSTSLSSGSYARTDSSSSIYPSSPSTSPGTTPPSPLSLKPPSSPASLASSSPRAYRSKAPSTQAERPHPRDRAHESQAFGIDPATLIGRTLTRVHRSRAHPSLTLHFADGGAVQVRVVGYDPQFRGVPKTLESDSHVLNPASGATDVRLTVKHAAMITLADKAFQVQGTIQGAGKPPRESRWTQKHAAFAVKFVEEGGWHCIWATLAEYDEKNKETCVFRNFADVYVDSLQSAPTLSGSKAPVHPHTRTASPHTRHDSPVSPSSAPKAQKPKRKGRGNRKAETPKARW